MKAKITVRLVDSVEPSDRDQIIWDTEVPGFGCKVTPHGRKSYFAYYRTREGQQRRPSIGRHGAIKPEAARDIARGWLSDVAKGHDPSQSRSEARAAPTVRDLCQRYMNDHAQTRKKASSVKGDQRLIDLHILPTLGAKKVAAVSRADVASLHTSMKRTPYEANRTLALASTMFRLAERWGLRPDGSNPATNIDRYRETKRERYLTEEEVARLWATLNTSESEAQVSPAALAAIKLLMVTGRRLSEVLTMEWSFIDWTRKTLRLPDTKSGALHVPLGEAALAILGTLRSTVDAERDNAKRSNKPWQEPRFVITGRGTSGRLINLQKPWRRIRQRAGLKDVRLHDLRHTFASIGAGLGMSLHMLGKLLGHTQTATTSRYAHLAQSPVQAAANTIDAELMRMARAMGNQPSRDRDDTLPTQ